MMITRSKRTIGFDDERTRDTFIAAVKMARFLSAIERIAKMHNDGKITTEDAAEMMSAAANNN